MGLRLQIRSSIAQDQTLIKQTQIKKIEKANSIFKNLLSKPGVLVTL